MHFEERSRLYPESGHDKACPVTTPLEKTLLFIVVVVVAIGIGLTIAIININTANDRNVKNLKDIIETGNNTCVTPSCVSEASNLLQSMDLSVDPCTDFYSFVCGNWIKNTHLITSLESQFTRLTKSITLRLKDILEDLQNEEDLPEYKRKAADFYKACMDEDDGKELGVEELMKDLKKFGGWPLLEDKEFHSSTFHWENLMVKFFRNGYVSSMLFQVKVDIDVKNASRSLIAINQPSLGLRSSINYVLEGEMTDSYKQILFKLAKLLKSDLDDEGILSAIEGAFIIENTLAKLTIETDMRLPDKFYNIMTIGELEKFASEIPWRKIIQGFLPHNTTLMEEERIMVTAPSMIKGLNDLLKIMDNAAGKKSIANYMFYRAVFQAARHLSKEYYLLVNILNIPNVPTLWEFCTLTSLEAFPHSVSASYVEKYVGNRTKDYLDSMVGDLRNSLADDIEHAEWLDDETKRYALFKAKEMDKVVAYQEEIMHDDILDDFYKDINITNNHFRNMKEVVSFQLRRSMEGLREVRLKLRFDDINSLLTANAYYYPIKNSIIIPVGVLQDTIFAPNRPNYINYGSLGMLIGHELTHAFDSIGGLYNAEGSYEMWWSKDSWNKFLGRTKCFEDQYNKYYMPIAEAHINGTMTLAENIADNGGLQTAYHAYNKLLNRIGSEKSLPGLSYNEKQMFWISYASVWCRKQTTESIQNAVKRSFHTHSQFRVIGSLSNIKEFSEDFNCKLNSTMNPESKCSLWK